MDHQLFGRKTDCFCILMQSNLQSGPAVFFPELLQQQVNNHNIPHFAPGAVLDTAFTSVFPQGS